MSPSQQAARLNSWLNDKAYPLWWKTGADHELGGFHEKIDQTGRPVVLPKRARVQPRQIFSFGLSPEWTEAVEFGRDFYLAHYLRPDGLFRTLVAPDGKPVDETPAFYDQAFALLGLNSLYRALGNEVEHRDRARALIAKWIELRKHPAIGFEEDRPRKLPLCSNPHMHLLESCLAWREDDPQGPWKAIAGEIVELALTKFIDSRTGVLREYFDGDWNPMQGDRGRMFEPGHQFEWAWLLMRWGQGNATSVALRLIDLAETHGVDQMRGVAINSLFDDFTPHDRSARLWPQTERIKAHCLAAEVTGKSDHWDKAELAARGLWQYLETPITGLWYDVLTEHDGFIIEPAPASSFYHITCAINELNRALG